MFTDIVEYLGLLLNREGFKGKDPAELKEKCNNALKMLTHEPWFNLDLHAKHISRAYQTYVRSILLYGAELLYYDDRQPLYELDNKLINILVGKLLKLGRGRLGEKHRLRIQLALGIPTLKMELDSLIAGRMDTWLEIRASTHAKIRNQACESRRNVESLPEHHLLKQELNKRAMETVGAWSARKKKGWAELRNACAGTSDRSGRRQIVAEMTGL